jgi:hypothetical protein
MALSPIAAWKLPHLQSAIAAIDDAWTIEQVSLLRSWAATHGDIAHREVAVSALDEHLSGTHKLETNDFLRVAYLLNGGLLLDETSLHEKEQGGTAVTELDDLNSLQDDFEKLLQDNESVSARVDQ